MKKLVNKNAFNINYNNLFVKRKCDFKKYSTDNSNKGPKGPQTWSEYLYPFFTSDYYYVGEIVVAVTIIGTGFFCYYHGPALLTYFYNDGKGNPPSSPSSSSSSQISNMADLKANSISQASNSMNNVNSDLITNNVSDSITNTITAVDSITNTEVVAAVAGTMSLPISTTIKKIIDPVNNLIAELNNGKYTKVISSYIKHNQFNEDIVEEAENITDIELTKEEDQICSLIKDVSEVMNENNKEDIGLQYEIIEQLIIAINILEENTFSDLNPTLSAFCTTIKNYAKMRGIIE